MPSALHGHPIANISPSRPVRTGGSDRVIYNLDLQTGDTSPLISKNDTQLNPTWSPDGRYLLYLAYNANPGIYLWVFNQRPIYLALCAQRTQYAHSRLVIRQPLYHLRTIHRHR